MKRLLPVLALIAVLVQPLAAQITIELQFEQQQFLPGEAIVAKARIGNFSGQTLTLGGTPDWLTFDVQNREGHPVERRGAPAVSGEFQLDSSSIATKRVNLAPHFDLSRPGRYRVTATIHVPQWDQRWTSKEVYLDVIKGTKIWERDFGIPNPAGGLPEMRKFALLEARYLDRPTLYVRLTDASEEQVFTVRPLGPLLAFSRPDGQMDRHNILHVLWQDGARTYSYATLAYGGEITLRRTYQVTDSRPVLRPGPDGTVQLVGGRRVVTSLDLPPEPPAPASPVPSLNAPPTGAAGSTTGSSP
jgi:hypothetical protein